MRTLRHPDDLTDLLAQCAFDSKTLEAIDRQEDDDGIGWIVCFEDTTPVMLDWFDDPSRLVFSAMLGAPAAERKSEVLQALMSYNAMWRRTGGMRSGLSGDEGQEQMQLFFEWHPATMDADNLPGAIERFAELADWWADYIARDEPGEAPPDTGLLDAARRA